MACCKAFWQASASLTASFADIFFGFPGRRDERIEAPLASNIGKKTPEKGVGRSGFDLAFASMFSRSSSLLFAILFATVSFASAGQTWNAFDDFWSKGANFPGPTTPNAWSYGSASTSQPNGVAAFTAFTDDNVELEIPTGGPLFKHANPGAPEPCVARANAAWYPGAPPMPPFLFVHPSDTSFAVVRWQAPEAGTYKVKATFLASGETGLKSVGIVRYKESGPPEDLMKPALINRQDTESGQKDYEGSVKLDAGEFVAFYVGNGGDGYAGDSVGLDAAIAAE